MLFGLERSKRLVSLATRAGSGVSVRPTYLDDGCRPAAGVVVPRPSHCGASASVRMRWCASANSSATHRSFCRPRTGMRCRPRLRASSPPPRCHRVWTRAVLLGLVALVVLLGPCLGHSRTVLGLVRHRFDLRVRGGTTVDELFCGALPRRCSICSTMGASCVRSEPLVLTCTPAMTWLSKSLAYWVLYAGL